MIVTTSFTPARRVGTCAYDGCELGASWLVAAATPGLSANAFSCDHHRPEREVHALRMLADMLAEHVAEQRAAVKARRPRRVPVVELAAPLSRSPFPASLDRE